MCRVQGSKRGGPERGLLRGGGILPEVQLPHSVYAHAAGMGRRAVQGRLRQGTLQLYVQHAVATPCRGIWALVFLHHTRNGDSM